MKLRACIIVVALLLAAIFFFWPSARDPIAPAEHVDGQLATAFESPGSGASFLEHQPLDTSNGIPARVRAPEATGVEVTPESPPEQTVEWQITRQQSMLKTLQRNLESREAQWRITTDPVEREALQNQIDILRGELDNQQSELRKLQEPSSAAPGPGESR